MEKPDEDLSPEELFQLHLTIAAEKLCQLIEVNLDVETRTNKLNVIEESLNSSKHGKTPPT